MLEHRLGNSPKWRYREAAKLMNTIGVTLETLASGDGEEQILQYQEARSCVKGRAKPAQIWTPEGAKTLLEWWEPERRAHEEEAAKRLEDEEEAAKCLEDEEEAAKRQAAKRRAHEEEAAKHRADGDLEILKAAKLKQIEQAQQTEDPDAMGDGSSGAVLSKPIDVLDGLLVEEIEDPRFDSVPADRVDYHNSTDVKKKYLGWGRSPLVPTALLLDAATDGDRLHIINWWCSISKDKQAVVRELCGRVYKNYRKSNQRN